MTVSSNAQHKKNHTRHTRHWQRMNTQTTYTMRSTGSTRPLRRTWQRVSSATLAALASLATLACLTACTTEGYDTGDGKYSYLRTDFAVASTDAQGHMDKFVADNGTLWHVSGTPQVSWMSVPDSSYRALVYYNLPAGYKAGASSGNGGNSVSVVNVVKVFTLNPKRADKTQDKTDPVTFDAMWLSDNGKYINLMFDIKTGNSNGESNGQSIGVSFAGYTSHSDDTITANLTFCHDQGNVPQYYSSRIYASIPVGELAVADFVSVAINTYNGNVTKTVALK